MKGKGYFNFSRHVYDHGRSSLLVLLIGLFTIQAYGDCPFFVKIGYYGGPCIGEVIGVTENDFGEEDNPTFQWYHEDTMVTGETEYFIVTFATGDYVLVTTESGCSDTSLAVSINISPTSVDITGDSLYCADDSTELTAVIGGPYSSIVWVDPLGVNFGGGLTSVFADQPGTYYVVVTDVNNCTSIDSIVMSEIDFSPDIDAVGDSIFTTTEGASYQWFKDFGPLIGATDPYYNATMDGIYQVEVVDSFGCSGFSPGFDRGGAFTFPAGTYIPCGETFNPSVTGRPTYSGTGGDFGFRDTYFNAGVEVYADSDFKMQGYEVGDWLPDLMAPDQNDSTAQLYAGGDIPSVVDVCALWCVPCQQQASELNGWLADITTAGIPAHYKIVLTEGSTPSVTSTLADAQGWATTYSIDESIMWGPLSVDFADSISLMSLPTFLVLGIDQEIIGRQEGYNTTGIEDMLNEYYASHPLCPDFDSIHREWIFSISGNEVILNDIQVITFTATCNDGFQNGDETDVDCGPSCPPCEGDSDDDGYLDENDNCPDIANPQQSDQNNNGIGDLCDPETSGIPGIGIGTETPKDGMHLEQGNVFLASELGGVIMKSPDGSCWKLSVSDSGQVSTVKVDCPQ